MTDYSFMINFNLDIPDDFCRGSIALPLNWLFILNVENLVLRDEELGVPARLLLAVAEDDDLTTLATFKGGVATRPNCSLACLLASSPCCVDRDMVYTRKASSFRIRLLLVVVVAIGCCSRCYMFTRQIECKLHEERCTRIVSRLRVAV